MEERDGKIKVNKELKRRRQQVDKRKRDEMKDRTEMKE